MKKAEIIDGYIHFTQIIDHLQKEFRIRGDEIKNLKEQLKNQPLKKLKSTPHKKGCPKISAQMTKNILALRS